MKAGETCLNCRYFQPEDEQLKGPSECHRNPPEWQPVGTSGWPLVLSIDFCGEFKSKYYEDDDDDEWTTVAEVDDE